MLNRLESDNRIEAMLFRPLWPASLLTSRKVDMSVMADWSPFVEDAVEFLESRKIEGQPTIGIGHSLGGIVHLWTALKRPDLYKGVVLVDPVLLPPHRLWLLFIARALGISRYIHPLIKSALRRKRSFKSIDEAKARFRGAPLFAEVSNEVIDDFVHSLFHIADPNDEKVLLQYPPEWEAKIYETLTVSHLWRDLPSLVPPVLIIRGANSDTFSSDSASAFRAKVPHARIVDVPQAGHLVPLERPEQVAAAINAFATDIL